MSGNKPDAEVDVTVELVRSLLADQHPDLAELSIVEVASGWDNVMLRLGDDLMVRAPRREVAAVLVEHELAVLPTLADELPLPIPAPVRTGRPAQNYPWPWSITPWRPGGIVALAELADPAREADRLGRFLAALHRVGDVEMPPNPYRGHFIGKNLAVNVERSPGIERGAELLDRFRQLIHVAPWPHRPVRLHADLHAANILAHDSGDGVEISAVIDWGDVCAGDPATDLAVAWMLFDEPDRDRFRAAASASEFGIDDDTWQRAHAWAVHFAIVYRANSADDATMSGIADRLVTRLLD